MIANTSIPDFNELLKLIPDASEFSINNEKISDELKEIYDSIDKAKEFESLESIELRLRSKGLSNDDLIKFAANQISWNEVTDWHNDELKKLNGGLEKLLGLYKSCYDKSSSCHYYAHQLGEISEQMAVKASFLEGQIKGRDTQKIILAKQGGIGKMAKYQPLKELAKKLVNKKNFNSRRNAAMTITPVILEESKRLNIPLSEAQAVITITGWLKKMGLPANI